MRLVTSVQLVVLAYILFVEGFGYLYLLMDQPGAYSFARQGETALGFVSAMYFSITTLSTAGFGDIAPLAPAPRIIVITEILVGMVFALFAFSLTISAIVNQRLLPPATAQAPRRAETKVKLAVPSGRASTTRRRD
jgi:voltage-gated potassium channel Kch